MKHIFLTLFLSLILFKSYSQDRTATEPLAERFISYFNAEQADSLYMLLSDEVKQKLPLTNVYAVFSQLKPLGNLLKNEYANSEKGITSYIATFEKSSMVLYLNFDKNNKVAGFFVNADKREKAALKAGEEPVTVKTSSSVIKGTLSVPKVSQKIPVALLIAGSGPTDRNGNSALSNGKPDYFLKISDSLRVNNIAVLRYDKRGVGESSTTKTEAEFNFEDGVNDASALINFLKKDTRFSRIIIAGHSEGSLTGILASEREKVDGLISLAGAGFPIDDIMKTQFKEVLPAEDYKIALGVLDSIKADKQVKQQLKHGLEVHFRMSIRPYLSSWMKYNPQTELVKLNIPVLIVQGTHDIQVNVENARQLKKAKPDAQLVLIEGMSHILKKAPADREQNIATYSNDDLQLHPKLISVLTQFINVIH